MTVSSIAFIIKGKTLAAILQRHLFFKNCPPSWDSNHRGFRMSAVKFMCVKLCGLTLPTDNKQLSDWISKVNVPVLGSLSVLGRNRKMHVAGADERHGQHFFFSHCQCINQIILKKKKKVECLFLCLNKQEQLPQHYCFILKLCTA